MARCSLLLSSVLLWQNPHGAEERLQRANLFRKMEEREGGGSLKLLIIVVIMTTK